MSISYMPQVAGLLIPGREIQDYNKNPDEHKDRRPAA